MKAYRAFAEAIRKQGVEPLFGLVGDANMQYVAHFVDALSGRYVGATHEAGAITMADGYHRSSGRLGAATVTHGPGFTNALTALTEAARARTSMVVLTGSTPAIRSWTQQLDLAAAAAPTGAGFERVYRPETAAGDLARAVHRARVERRPVVLDFPWDMLQEEVEPIPASAVPPFDHLPPRPTPAALERALDLIAGSKRPLVLAGRGAALSGARQDLIDLAELLGAPLATTLLGRELFRGHPLDLGIAGSLSSSIATDALVKADLILAFGAGLNRYTTHRGELTAESRIVQIDLRPDDLGLVTPIDAALIGDAGEVARMLVRELREAGFDGTSWAAHYAEQLAAWDPLDEFVDLSTDDTLDVRRAVIELDRVLPTDRTVVTDVGRFIVAGWRFLRVPSPTRFTHMSTFGSIGLGLGAGIGAALADPSSLTVLVAGDGGFMMTAGELSTAVRHHIPLLVVVLDDGAYGAETNKLRAHGESPELSYVDWPEIAPLAAALGARSMTARSVGDLRRIPELLAGLEGPALVDVKLDRTAEVGHW